MSTNGGHELAQGLLRAVVVQRLRKRSAAHRALYSQSCSNSSLSRHADGGFRLPDAPGLGVEMDEAALDRHAGG